MFGRTINSSHCTSERGNGECVTVFCESREERSYLIEGTFGVSVSNGVLTFIYKEPRNVKNGTSELLYLTCLVQEVNHR